MDTEYIMGDRVEFKARGRTLVGIIERLWWTRPRSLYRRACRKARIVPEGQSREYWTVPVSSITRKIESTGGRLVMSAEHGAASNVVNTIQNAKKQRQRDRANRNYEAAEENNLLNLYDGAPIEVEFRDAGWLPATFRGFVNGSGNVRFERNGVRRISAARFVRKRNS